VVERDKGDVGRAGPLSIGHELCELIVGAWRQDPAVLWLELQRLFERCRDHSPHRRTELVDVFHVERSTPSQYAAHFESPEDSLHVPNVQNGLGVDGLEGVTRTNHKLKVFDRVADTPLAEQ